MHSSYECNYILVKTPLGMENVAAAYIRELDPEAEIEVSPKGFKGLVLVKPKSDRYTAARKIESGVPEAEKVIPIEACSSASLEEIAKAAAELATRHIKSGETFAVRTVRRGKHGFRSIDVNIVVGDHVRRSVSASVNLSEPDKIVQVEIIGDQAFLAIIPGEKIWKKMKRGKHSLYKFFWRLSVVQMPYLGPLDACKTMGVRIGREVQNFEVGELVIAPVGLVDALQLKSFLDGVFEGIESRYRIQKRSYGREVKRVNVGLQDLYQLVRSRAGETLIVFEPEGRPAIHAREELLELLRRGKRVNLLFGSREGIPEGVYRFASLVLDIAPGITLSTDYAAAAALSVLGMLVHDDLARELASDETHADSTP